jgi:general secretion pathway protein I
MVKSISKKHNQHGFTLLETLVALSVLAITLGVIYQIFGTSLRNIQHAKDYSFAQMHAESKLSEIGKGIPVVEGSYGGDIDEKYRWRVYVEPASSINSESVVFVFKVTLTISWGTKGKDRSIEVSTLRLSSGEV